MRSKLEFPVKNIGLSKALPLAIASATILFSSPAFAAGTAAGSTISNTATATYTDSSGNEQTIDSNTVEFLVDELLDVTVARVGTQDIVTTPGATNQVATFTITNNGNGDEAFTLTPNVALGGDQFDPTLTQVVLDTNGNGVYDPGVDTVYTAGSNDPLLNPDESITVFVISTIPAGATDQQRGQVSLTAEAVTGTGAPGDNFPNAGQGGGDAVVGNSGGDGTDNAFYLINNATISFTKTQSVLDPFGGTDVVPGSIITYTLVATVSGTGSLANVAMGDPVPTGTTYQAGTLTLESAAVSDAADTDAGEYVTGTPNRVAVRLGSVASGQTRTVTFKVLVN